MIDNFYKIALVILGMGLLTGNILVNQPKPEANVIKYQDENEDIVISTEKEANSELDFWILSLAKCESSNNPSAYNPKDNDGTPSYGLFQFKLKTFRYYVEKYNLFPQRKNWEESDWLNMIYDGDVQKIVLRKMLQDKKVNWKNEFPKCIKKIGLPPIR